MVVKQDKVPFEDALRMAGFGKFNLLAFLLCSSIILSMTFEIFSVSYLVPGSACELGTSSEQQGMMAAVPLIGIILTSHLWGYMADTKGRRKTLVVSMCTAFVAGTLAAFSPNWIVLSALKLCSSASVSGANAMSLTLLSEYTVQAKRSIFILLTTSIYLVSNGIMAVLSMPILSLKFSYYIPVLGIYFNSWRVLNLIFVMPCALSAVGVYFSYESPKYLLSVGKHDEALEILRKIFARNSGKSGDLFRVNSIILDEESKIETVGFWSSFKAQTLPMLRKPFLKDTILFSLLIFIVYICMNPYQVWLPFIVNAAMTSVENGNVDLTLCQMIRMTRNSTMLLEKPTDCSMNEFAMKVVFFISFATAIINLVTSAITQCIGRKALIISLQLIGGAAAIYINFSYNWIMSAACFMIFLSGITNFATLTSYCVEIYPTYVKAMAVCITLMIGRGSAIVGINLVKALLDNNCEAGFYIFGSIFAVGGVVALLLPTDRQVLQRKEVFKEQLTDAS